MAKSRLNEACDRISEWLRRSNGNNAIADYMDKEAIVTLIEHAQKKPEPHLIRVFLDGGLVQAITNIPKGTIVRRIDLDVEGAPDEDTTLLDNADKPPYADKPKNYRAFVEDWPSVKEEPPPFGAVRFDQDRKTDGQSNGERAELGKHLVALSYLLCNRETGYLALIQWADSVNLDEVPELPLTDALVNLQHYAHRDQITLYGEEGAWAIAQKQFNEQSGGAAL